MKPTGRKGAGGMTVLELIIATTMLTMVLTTVGVVMRTGHAAWQAQEEDFTRLEAAHATVRHIVRRVRQAQAVTQISAPTDTAGQLALQLPDGRILAWQRKSDNVVYFNENVADQMLAEPIAGLKFIGYRADGVTTTTTLDEVQALEIEATAQLPQQISGTRTIRSWAWLRAW